MVQVICVIIWLVLFNNICGLVRAFECSNFNVTPCRTNVPLCERICESDGCEIRALVVLPNSTAAGTVISLEKVLFELTVAVEDARATNLLPEWLKVRFIPKDDQCTESYAQIGVIEAYSSEQCPHVIFGPICEFPVATVTRIVKFYGTPLLSPGGLSQDFERPKLSCADDYFMFVRTSSFFFKGISLFFKDLMLKYNWRKVQLLYDKDGQYEVAGPGTCSLFMQTFIMTLSDLEGLQHEDGDLGLSSMNLSDFLRTKIGVDKGVVVMCVSYPKAREILLTAESLDNMMYNGEYVFFNIELTSGAKHPEKPWLDPTDTDENNKRLEAAYKSVITLTSKTQDFAMTTENAIARVKSKFISDFYNSMWMYLQSLNTFLKGPNEKDNLNTLVNGYELVQKIYGSHFIDRNNESVSINCEGSRMNEYSLLSYSPKKKQFQVVANYIQQENKVEFLEGRTISWPGGSATPPPDTPRCGYDNSKCPETTLPMYVIISIALVGVAILLVIIAIFMYRRYKLEAEISSMSWKVAWNDIIDLQSTASRRDSLSSSAKRGSQVTFNSELYSLGGDRQIFMPIGFYKNSKVAIRRLAPVKVDLSRAQLVRLKQMKDLTHEHLVRFHGACIDPPNCCILMEYCPKGSLQDILENEQFTLEWMIRISLIQDLVRAMTYLHQSEIKSHGNLTSTNCVVDSRFVLKVTDFGLLFFKKHETPNSDSYAFWRRKLWTAPELLRMPSPPEGGSQKGDVYSFAIIIHEIIVRQGLFYLGEGVELTPNDIVNSIKNNVQEGDGMVLRPYIDHGVIEDEVATLMQKCWNENPAERPDFSTLKNTIKKLNKEHDNGNILDNLLSRMEQYANNLESLVEERTADYLEEKKKCEELLYQLLPRSVAAQLIRGEPVLAEAFEQVTIYFSDIVGFTSLSAASTPLEVVALLNDLYTCFDSIIESYDVYKVETIGDAYMVVSGLPTRNGRLHAREVARMALALLAAVHSFRIRHRPGERLRLRIGLHTGACVAGVVGLKMPRYCLFGDTVNTASRMESNGEPLRIHVSPDTKRALEPFPTFQLVERGPVELKGKGTMVTYWLTGETPSFDEISQLDPNLNTTTSAKITQSKIKSDDNEAESYRKTPHPGKNNLSARKRKDSLRTAKHRVNFKNNIQAEFDIADKTKNNAVPLLKYTSIK